MIAASNILSLASGVMPGASPLATAIAATEAGFDAVGLWIEPEDWTAETTREVRSHLASSGLRVLDVEVVWIKPGPPDPKHLRIVEIGAELGADNVLIVSSDPDRADTIHKFARICEHAAAAGIRPSLEFAPFTDVPTLEDALAVIAAAGNPTAGLLIDPLHLSRSGATPEDLSVVPSHLFKYAQFCDAPAWGRGERDRASLRQEAVDDRLCPGEGELPLAHLLDVLPALLPLSVELRSRHLRDRFVDLNERASHVARLTRHWLRQHGRAGA